MCFYISFHTDIRIIVHISELACPEISPALVTGFILCCAADLKSLPEENNPSRSSFITAVQNLNVQLAEEQ